MLLSCIPWRSLRLERVMASGKACNSRKGAENAKESVKMWKRIKNKKPFLATPYLAWSARSRILGAYPSDLMQ